MSTSARRTESRRPAAAARRRGLEPPSSDIEALISDAEFARFQALIHREAGIWLAPAKRSLLVGRLGRRLRELGMEKYGEYFQRVEADPAERIRMLDRVTTNETHFFREPRHFQFLGEEVFPRWRRDAEAGRRQRRARIWSAACSTGEEPYTIAMSLLRAFPAGSGWDLEILATDLSTRVLDRAAAGVWPLEKASEIPEADLKTFMLRGFGEQEGLMKAGPEIRSLVRFTRLNLNEPSYPVSGQFDLVFCRNVLIYFDAPTKEKVVGRLLRFLVPGGYLFLGHAESLSGISLPIRSVLPTVYGHWPAGGVSGRGEGV
jgi:chemotaxis protein methyltransferase CheR